MFEVIHKDTVLYTTDSKKDAREYLFVEAERHSMKFCKGISRYGRIDFLFYCANNKNELDIYTIIKN